MPVLFVLLEAALMHDLLPHPSPSPTYYTAMLMGEFLGGHRRNALYPCPVSAPKNVRPAVEVPCDYLDRDLRNDPSLAY